MASSNRAQQNVSVPGAAPAPATPRRLGPLDVLVLSLWCVLAAGLLEVAARVLSRSVDTPHRLYNLSRHFVWLVPISDLLLFSAIGVFLAVCAKCWPRPGSWLSPRILRAFAVLPMLMVAGPNIFTEAFETSAMWRKDPGRPRRPSERLHVEAPY